MSFSSKLAVAAIAFAAAGSAFATPVSVSYTSFGKLAGATFGGTGISNDYVAITKVGDMTMGLTVTPRYSSPAVTNNGAGVFYAEDGAYGPGDNLALWNFDYYYSGAPAGTTFKLLVDRNPAVGNDISTYADMTLYFLFLGGKQNSENLGFNSSYSQFDPTESGEYGIVLEAFSRGQEVGRTSILVEVGEHNVPEPASLALVAVALGGVGFASRRRAGR